MKSIARVFFLANATLLLCGCGERAPSAGSQPDSQQGLQTGAQPAPRTQLGGKKVKPVALDPAQEAENLTRGMVNAVSQEKVGAPVQMKFDLQSRPEIGQPLQIALAFLPQAAGNALRASFPATPNLTIQPASLPAEYQKVQADGVYRYELTVVPGENGMLIVSAIVNLDLPDGAQARTFSIPILVGPPAD
jgi:hypothetical protein